MSSAKPTYRLLVAMVLAVVLMALDQRTPWTQSVRYTLDYIAAPVHYVAHLPTYVIDFATRVTERRSGLVNDKQRLQRQVLILEQKVQRLAVLEAENVRLRELLNSSASLEASVLVAEIIGIDPDPNRQEVVINKGAHDDVTLGQAVLDSRGLIGQVVDVGPFSARVLLVTDASHALSVQVNRNGVRAILAGTGQGSRLQLLYVPDTADVQNGDLLVSTGLGQVYPRGYPVARVTRVGHHSGAAFAEIEARPTSHLDRVTHVLLVQSMTPLDPQRDAQVADDSQDESAGGHGKEAPDGQ